MVLFLKLKPLLVIISLHKSSECWLLHEEHIVGQYTLYYEATNIYKTFACPS